LLHLGDEALVLLLEISGIAEGKSLAGLLENLFRVVRRRFAFGVEVTLERGLRSWQVQLVRIPPSPLYPPLQMRLR
jgi:hypothetical protein